MLSDLYQELILDHSRNSAYRGKQEDCTHEAKGHNPLCGDKVTVFITVGANGTIETVRFDGEGCAISTASASLMSEALTGKTLAEAEGLFEIFHRLLTHDAPLTTENEEKLGKLEAFSGVYEFPMRVKCATLPWHTLQAALKASGGVVKTE